MSYEDKALRQTFSFPAATISGAATTYSIKPPAGRRGRLVAIHGSVTTTIVGAAVAIQVGVSGTLTKFGSLAIGAQTAPEALSTEAFTRNATTKVQDMAEASDEILVTVTAGTSGALVPSVTFDFF